MQQTHDDAAGRGTVDLDVKEDLVSHDWGHSSSGAGRHGEGCSCSSHDRELETEAHFEKSLCGL